MRETLLGYLQENKKLRWGWGTTTDMAAVMWFKKSDIRLISNAIARPREKTVEIAPEFLQYVQHKNLQSYLILLLLLDTGLRIGKVGGLLWKRLQGYALKDIN
jgi:integrase